MPITIDRAFNPPPVPTCTFCTSRTRYVTDERNRAAVPCCPPCAADRDPRELPKD